MRPMLLGAMRGKINGATVGVSTGARKMPMSDGSIDFRRVLEHSPNPYLLLDAELHISWANHAYLAAVGRELDDIAGSHVFEAFPGAGESHHLIESSFERVLETGEPDEIVVWRDDARLRPLPARRIAETRNEPILAGEDLRKVSTESFYP